MRPVSCARATYQRRQPEQTVLYQTIAAHLPAFLARTAGADGTGGWPAFVRREFEAYLRCGILDQGLLRPRAAAMKLFALRHGVTSQNAGVRRVRFYSDPKTELRHICCHGIALAGGSAG